MCEQFQWCGNICAWYFIVVCERYIWYVCGISVVPWGYNQCFFSCVFLYITIIMIILIIDRKTSYSAILVVLSWVGSTEPESMALGGSGPQWKFYFRSISFTILPDTQWKWRWSHDLTTGLCYFSPGDLGLGSPFHFVVCWKMWLAHETILELNIFMDLDC